MVFKDRGSEIASVIFDLVILRIQDDLSVFVKSTNQFCFLYSTLTLNNFPLGKLTMTIEISMI